MNSIAEDKKTSARYNVQLSPTTGLLALNDVKSHVIFMDENRVLNIIYTDRAMALWTRELSTKTISGLRLLGQAAAPRQMRREITEP